MTTRVDTMAVMRSASSTNEALGILAEFLGAVSPDSGQPGLDFTKQDHNIVLTVTYPRNEWRLWEKRRNAHEFLSEGLQKLSKLVFVSEESRINLLDDILFYVKSNLESGQRELLDTIKSDNEAHHSSLARITGLSDDSDEFEFDYKTGDAYLRLIETLPAAVAGITDITQYRGLSNAALQLMNTSDSSEELRKLLQNVSLFTSVRHYISALARPARVRDALIMLAQSFPPSTSVTIRDAANAKRLHPSFQIHKTERSNSETWTQPTDDSSKALTPSTRRSNLNAQAPEINPKVMQRKEAREYLPTRDRLKDAYELVPECRITFILLEGLLEGKNPRPSSEEYHVFGFLGCLSAEQELLLGHLYRSIFIDAADKVSAFELICQAVRSSCLFKLFESEGHEHTEQPIQKLPIVYRILQHPPARRPSVFNLIAFVHSDNMEPDGVLRRDFGFRNCQGTRGRSEIEALKTIYGKMVQKSSPENIQQACERGELWEHAAMLKIGVQIQHRRLMQSARHTDQGFWDGRPVPGYHGPMFKTSSSKKR